MRIHTLFPVIWVIKYFIKWKAETVNIAVLFCDSWLLLLSFDFPAPCLPGIIPCFKLEHLWGRVYILIPSDRMIAKMIMKASRGFAADIHVYHIHRLFRGNGKKRHQEKFSLHPSCHRSSTFCTKGSTLFLHHQDIILDMLHRTQVESYVWLEYHSHWAQILQLLHTHTKCGTRFASALICYNHISVLWRLLIKLKCTSVS
jgi:hypothetical protein